MTDTNSGAANFTVQFAINGQRGVGATFAMDGAYSIGNSIPFGQHRSIDALVANV
jgi:hypothetical protein